MLNKVASSFYANSRLQCMTNCSVSPVCDSYNYHPSDKTCQFNTHDTPHTLETRVSTLLPVDLSSDKTCQLNTHTTLHTL